MVKVKGFDYKTKQNETQSTRKPLAGSTDHSQKGRPKPFYVGYPHRRHKTACNILRIPLRSTWPFPERRVKHWEYTALFPYHIRDRLDTEYLCPEEGFSQTSSSVYKMEDLCTSKGLFLYRNPLHCS